MPHPDLDELLGALIPFAQDMLAKHGEFYPFAASMGADGAIAQVGADTGNDHPQSLEVVDLLVAGLRQQASRGEIKATGLCLDVRTVPPGEDEKVDAICARLEHAEGEAVDVFLPYRSDEPGKIDYGELFASQGPKVVFPKVDV